MKDIISFSQYTYMDMLANSFVGSKHNTYIQSYSIKKVNVNVNPPKNVDFTSADLVDIFELLTAAIHQVKASLLIMKPIVVLTEEYN